MLESRSNPPDPYVVLQVPASASPDQIRRAYRRLLKRYHPDLNPEDPDAERRFLQIQGAYETLRRTFERLGREKNDQRAAARVPMPPATDYAAFGYGTQQMPWKLRRRLRQTLRRGMNRMQKWCPSGTWGRRPTRTPKRQPSRTPEQESNGTLERELAETGALVDAMLTVVCIAALLPAMGIAAASEGVRRVIAWIGDRIRRR